MTTDEADGMDPDQRHRAYWRKSLLATGALLSVWFCATFVVAYFARDLQVHFAGWPLGFWVGAQGGLVVFVGINWAHARYMERLDAAYGMDNDPEGPTAGAPPAL
jgi:putative solute:sodium symporter small subunit